jgi:spoIIIJ-associated protein
MGEPVPAPEGLPDPSGLAKFTEELLAKMGFQARVEAGYSDDAYEVKIEAGEDDAILIGRKGETLDAMQHVLAKMVSRGHEELLRVRVDVSEYRQRRSSELSDRALAWAQQVRDTGREVITEPLPAAERRVIHRTLSDLADVRTQALGEGLVKPVWIGPQGENPPMDAPEMDHQLDHQRDRQMEEPRPRRAAPVDPIPVAEGEPVSLIDPWSAPPAKSDAAPVAPAEEWGRRPKPARGRRR